MRILITGPQGCGKTTQAQILAKKLGVCFIGAGDLLREFAEGASREAKDVDKDLDKGELVDDDLVAGLVKKKIALPECQLGSVTDGYPRTFSQHQIYDPEYDKVFYLDISDEEAERRLLARGREDDTSEVIRARLGWYHKETQPLLDYYQRTDKLKKINGEHSIEEIAAEIEDQVRGEMA